MDKLGKFDWKHIQQIVGDYTGNEPKKPDGPKITPIFAHASDQPVELSGKSKVLVGGLISSPDSFGYSYVFTLIETGEKYRTSIQAFLLSPYGEVPILFDEKFFPKNIQRAQVIKEMHLPFTYFKRSKNLRVMTFKDTDMREEDFENLIELWRTTPPQT